MQKKKVERKYTFLISVTLLVFSSGPYSSPLIVFAIPSYYNSAQQANTKTMNAELASIGDRPYSSPQRHDTDAASLTNTFATYENPTYGITIQYPSNWEKIEYPRLGLEVLGSDIVVNLLAPLENASDHWREHLMIQVLKQTQAKKLIPESIIILGGQHGYTRVYNSTMEISNLDSNTEVRLHLKTLEVWVTVGNGDTYLLTYKAVSARYSYYLPTIQKMLSSFRITVPNNSTMQ